MVGGVKRETCPIEEKEVLHFKQLLRVMGLSLVKIKDTFGSVSKESRVIRGKFLERMEGVVERGQGS